MTELRVTAVIRSKNEAESIAETLQSVMRQNMPVEILVIDSGSTDGTLDVARSMGVKIIGIPADTFSYGGSINVGVSAASGDLVLILSAHCSLPGPTWLEDAVRHFKDPRVVGVNGISGPSFRESNISMRSIVDCLRLDESDRVLEQREPISGFVGFSNHASLVRRDAAMAHPFEEHLSACEDKEWANRVVQQGFVVLYDPTLLVSGLHRRQQGFRALYLRARNEANALSDIAGAPAWSVSQGIREAAFIFVARRGVKRLAPLRPCNLVESVGRVAGSRRSRSLSHSS